MGESVNSPWMVVMYLAPKLDRTHATLCGARLQMPEMQNSENPKVYWWFLTACVLPCCVALVLLGRSAAPVHSSWRQKSAKKHLKIMVWGIFGGAFWGGPSGPCRRKKRSHAAWRSFRFSPELSHAAWRSFFDLGVTVRWSNMDSMRASKTFIKPMRNCIFCKWRARRGRPPRRARRTKLAKKGLKISVLITGRFKKNVITG